MVTCKMKTANHVYSRGCQMSVDFFLIQGSSCPKLPKGQCSLRIEPQPQNRSLLLSLTTRLAPDSLSLYQAIPHTTSKFTFLKQPEYVISNPKSPAVPYLPQSTSYASLVPCRISAPVTNTIPQKTIILLSLPVTHLSSLRFYPNQPFCRGYPHSISTIQTRPPSCSVSLPLGFQHRLEPRYRPTAVPRSNPIPPKHYIFQSWATSGVSCHFLSIALCLQQSQLLSSCS